MSNALTSIFFDVLVTAGCDLATTPWERALVYWLVQHDQSRLGLGIVGFDVEEMGWTHESFESERRFVTTLVDSALRRHGWDRLPFSPAEEHLFPALEQFRKLVLELPSNVAGSVSNQTWVPGELPDRGLCDVHRVYLHETGCIICNDVPLDAPSAAAPNRSL